MSGGKAQEYDIPASFTDGDSATGDAAGSIPSRREEFDDNLLIDLLNPIQRLLLDLGFRIAALDGNDTASEILEALPLVGSEVPFPPAKHIQTFFELMEFFSVKHGINAQFRRRTLAPQADKGDVAFRLNRQEMLDKIDDMIRSKRMKIDESNRREFLKRKDPEDSCSRVDAVQVNRSVQMKLDVVVNQDGPLARSTSSSAAPNSSNRDGTLNGVEARIRNAETHLGIASVKPIHIDVYKRLKRVEDRITLLEEIYPAWAATHFRQPNNVTVSDEVNVTKPDEQKELKTEELHESPRIDPQISNPTAGPTLTASGLPLSFLQKRMEELKATLAPQTLQKRMEDMKAALQQPQLDTPVAAPPATPQPDMSDQKSPPKSRKQQPKRTPKPRSRGRSQQQSPQLLGTHHQMLPADNNNPVNFPADNNNPVNLPANSHLQVSNASLSILTQPTNFSASSMQPLRPPFPYPHIPFVPPPLSQNPQHLPIQLPHYLPTTTSARTLALTSAPKLHSPSSVLVSNSTVSSTASSATPSANPFYSLQPDPPLQN